MKARSQPPPSQVPPVCALTCRYSPWCMPAPRLVCEAGELCPKPTAAQATGSPP